MMDPVASPARRYLEQKKIYKNNHCKQKKILLLIMS